MIAPPMICGLTFEEINKLAEWRDKHDYGKILEDYCKAVATSRALSARVNELQDRLDRATDALIHYATKDE